MLYMTISLQTVRYAQEVERRRGGQSEHYNILPLHFKGVKSAIMELPEVGSKNIGRAFSKTYSLNISMCSTFNH